MAWFEGTTTDYKDLLALVEEFASNDNVQSVSVIDDGGSGFVVGETVNVSGGTSTTTAVIEVVAVSAGVVTEARMISGGAYTVLPSTTQTSLSGSASGTGLDVTLTTQSAGWTKRIDRTVQRPDTVVVNAGGSSYTVGDKVNIAGGTELRPTILNVDSVSSGAVTGLSIDQRGIYSPGPSATGASTTTSDGGSGLTVDIVYKDEEELLLEGSGSGSDEIFVGARTYSGFSGENYFNWEVAGFTGFNASAQWASQPGITDGRYDDDTNIGGCFVPLRNVSMDYWMSITSNRIIVVALTGGNIANCFLGFINPTSNPSLASGLYPYPLLVAGCSTNPVQVATSTIESSFSAFHDPVVIGASNSFNNDYSYCQLNSPGNNWLHFRNAVTGTGVTGGTSRIAVDERTVHPIGDFKTIVSGDDSWLTAALEVNFQDFTTRTFTAPINDIIPTPGSGGDEYLLVPLTMISYVEPIFIAGQIPDCFWFSAEGAIADNGSVINAGGNRYRVFQNGRYSDAAQWWCVLEG